MSKRTNHAEDARSHLKSRLEKAQAELDVLDEERRLKKVEVLTLAKGLRAFERTTGTKSNGKISPTLKHVAEGIRVAFKDKQRLPKRELQQRTLEILKSQECLSTQGLALRVKQGLAKLDVDAEGFVLAPRVSTQPKSGPAT
jgi:hypothetical protein